MWLIFLKPQAPEEVQHVGIWLGTPWVPASLPAPYSFPMERKICSEGILVKKEKLQEAP